MVVDRIDPGMRDFLLLGVLENRPFRVDGVVAHHLLVELLVVGGPGDHQCFAAIGFLGWNKFLVKEQRRKIVSAQKFALRSGTARTNSEFLFMELVNS